MTRRYYVRRTLEMTRDTRRKNYKHELRRKAYAAKNLLLGDDESLVRVRQSLAVVHCGQMYGHL